MGETVLADPQFGVVRVLRPYADFEDVYQGQAANIPIMLTESGEALDEQAGDTGYDERLVRGLTVPVGARILLAVPNTFSSPGIGQLFPYIYTLSWRFRNLSDFRLKRKSYHFPKQGTGVPETLVDPGDRVPLAVTNQPVIYNQAEVAAGPAQAVQTQNLHTENVRLAGIGLTNPINPDGSAGALQQGILTPTASNAHTRSFFSTQEVQAISDELLISVTREDNDGASANWAFAAGETDDQFSEIYGKGLAAGIFPDVGIYVMVGVSP